MDSESYRNAELLTLFTRGLTDHSALEAGLKMLEIEFGAANVQMMLLLDGHFPSIAFTGFDQNTMDLYGRHVEHDIWLNRYKELGTQRVMRGSDMVSRKDLDHSFFKAELLKPLGLGYSLGAGKQSDNGMALISMQRGSHDFSEQQVVRLEHYFYLLSGFISAAQRISQLERSNFSLSALADRCPDPALVVDKHSHVICCNTAFEQTPLTGVNCRDQQLIVKRKPLHDWLENWPEGTQSELVTAAEECPVVVERLYPVELYFVTCYRKGIASSSTRLKLLQACYRLTFAETEMVGLLAKGLTLETIAKQRSISYYTVRSQLRSVFSKTGCHHQSELLLLVR